VTISGGPDAARDVEAYVAAGVDRLVVAPWQRSSEWLAALRDFAGRCLP
jgi:hypothetical protein